MDEIERLYLIELIGLFFWSKKVSRDGGWNETCTICKVAGLSAPILFFAPFLIALSGWVVTPLYGINHFRRQV